jgi:hypothetical protein
MKSSIEAPLDLTFDGGKIKLQGFDREAQEAVEMYTIELTNEVFWFEVLKYKVADKYAIRIMDFGWPERYKLRRRAHFTQASADSARKAIKIFFTAPNQSVLDFILPKEQWITEVVFSPGWILVGN